MYTYIKDFEFWCQKVLPLVYDESLSYYELLCKTLDYIRIINNNVDFLNENFTSLESFVQNYFNNLDVQTEVNNKIEEMKNNGELAALIDDKLFEKYKTRSPFANRKVVCYGDSTITVKNNYIDQLKNMSGAEVVVNRGVPGTCMSHYNNNGVDLISASTDLDTFDIITLSYGTNEWQTELSLDESVNSLFRIIQTIVSKAPNIEIVLILPFYSYHNFSNGVNINSLGLRLEDYVNILKFYSNLNTVKISCIDFYHDSPCGYSNYKKLLLNDSGGIYVHPTPEFSTQLCSIVTNFSTSSYNNINFKNFLFNYDFARIRSVETCEGTTLNMSQGVTYLSSKKPFYSRMCLKISGNTEHPITLTLENLNITLSGAFNYIIPFFTVKSGVYRISLRCDSANNTVSRFKIEAGVYDSDLVSLQYNQSNKVSINTNFNSTVNLYFDDEGFYINNDTISENITKNAVIFTLPDDIEVKKQITGMITSYFGEVYPVIIKTSGEFLITKNFTQTPGDFLMLSGYYRFFLN